jgi:putative PIG3 family NAD(P)H quinone oxidoreductase
MKAATIVSYGGVEGLEVREVETPASPTADRVRVRVHAAALNRADILQRQGRYPAPPGVPQNVPGLEFAGEVDQVGEDARAWQPGQRVFGITGGGAQAEYVVVPENTLAEIPTNLDWAAAAGVPEAFITAHDALFTQAELQIGEIVLIHAAGSGVGTAAIQLARAAGARVYGTSRTTDKLERAKPLGLDNAVVVDQPDVFVDAVRQWTNGQGVDVILDLVGGAYFEGNVSALAPKGRLMLVATTAGSQATLDFSTVMRKRLRLTGTVLRARSAEEKAAATRLFVNHVVPLLASGAVRPIVDSTYSLDEIRAAHARLESNKTFGKVVLMLGQ